MKSHPTYCKLSHFNALLNNKKQIGESTLGWYKTPQETWEKALHICNEPYDLSKINNDDMDEIAFVDEQRVMFYPNDYDFSFERQGKKIILNTYNDNLFSVVFEKYGRKVMFVINFKNRLKLTRNFDIFLDLLNDRDNILCYFGSTQFKFQKITGYNIDTYEISKVGK